MSGARRDWGRAGGLLGAPARRLVVEEDAANDVDAAPPVDVAEPMAAIFETRTAKSD